MMSWCRSDDKPLSESMVVRLLTIICVTRPQWVKLAWWLLMAWSGVPKCNQVNGDLFGMIDMTSRKAMKKTMLSVCWHVNRTCPLSKVYVLRQKNGRHFADDILKYIFSNKRVRILVTISHLSFRCFVRSVTKMSTRGLLLIWNNFNSNMDK